MADPVGARHALSAFLERRTEPAADAGQVTVEVRPQLAQFNLRGPTDDGAFLLCVARVLGQSLPCNPNTCSAHPNQVFWLGPDEWLIVTEAQRGADLLRALRASIADHAASATDLTGGQIALRLAGPGVRGVLDQGCTLDLHPRAFLPGACAQTGLAKASVLIARLGEPAVFDLIVRRSFAEYVALWLQHAGRNQPLRFAQTGDLAGDRAGPEM